MPNLQYDAIQMDKNDNTLKVIHNNYKYTKFA